MADFDLNSMLEQAKQMQEHMQNLQQELAKKTVEGSAGAGMVKVTMTGAQRVVSVQIDPSVLSDDREMLQDLIVAATNHALGNVREITQQGMSGLVPPGMFPNGIPEL